MVAESHSTSIFSVHMYDTNGPHLGRGDLCLVKGSSRNRSVLGRNGRRQAEEGQDGHSVWMVFGVSFNVRVRIFDGHWGQFGEPKELVGETHGFLAERTTAVPACIRIHHVRRVVDGHVRGVDSIAMVLDDRSNRSAPVRGDFLVRTHHEYAYGRSGCMLSNYVMAHTISWRERKSNLASVTYRWLRSRNRDSRRLAPARTRGNEVRRIRS